MDIKKEREAFEESNNVKPDWSFKFDDELQQYVELDHEMQAQVEEINEHWDTFRAGWQAAKAQAEPEGFVLVKKVHPDAIVHNQGLGLFKECQVIYGWDGKSKDFKDALNKGFYHGVKLGAKAVLETAMIEAQEQGHD
ncbi:hypothetical protein [Acinetobacter indicus]|uniref:hypothetical protein n=1 Tax=Acinetobacter indicus TaxID=756892 RepID=UPI001E417ED3|nr:hypothetical protein [Acinetobacter indicus]